MTFVSSFLHLLVNIYLLFLCVSRPLYGGAHSILKFSEMLFASCGVTKKCGTIKLLHMFPVLNSGFVFAVVCFFKRGFQIFTVVWCEMHNRKVKKSWVTGRCQVGSWCIVSVLT